MPFSAAAVANKFLQLAKHDGKTITPLKMQKLVYFAHGWHLALFGKPLIAEVIQAWQYGPVISSLYQKFKHYGASPIDRYARVITQDGPLPARLDREGASESEIENARAVIKRVWQQYGRFSASQLTTLTHGSDAPWSKVPNKELPETPIPDRMIRAYFEAQVAHA